MYLRNLYSNVGLLLGFVFFFLQPVPGIANSLDEEYIFSPNTLDKIDLLVHDIDSRTAMVSMPTEPVVRFVNIGDGDRDLKSESPYVHDFCATGVERAIVANQLFALQDVTWQHTITSL